MPKKSSARKKTTAIKTELTEYNKDKTPDLSLEANNNTITIIKGSKTKPGMLSMPNISDYRLGRNVAFDLGSDVGLNLVQMFNNKWPNEAIERITKNGELKEYIYGVVNKLAKLKGRKHYYNITWCYSSHNTYNVDLHKNHVDAGILLSKKNVIISRINDHTDITRSEKYSYE